MTKIRLILLSLSLLVIGVIGTLVFLYARGYRFDPKSSKFSPNGLLVIKSAPDGARVFVNGDFKSVTNATLPLLPGTYDVRVEKEGYLTWAKRLTIEKEIVTEATSHLFKSAPSLSAITFTGVSNPVPSYDFTKIAYVVPSSKNSGTQESAEGLWVMEMLNLPLGFARDPRRITDGDLTDASWIWSPDGREILLTTSKGVFLLPSYEFTSQSKRVNIASNKDRVISEWEKEKTTRFAAKLKKLPDELEDIFKRKVSSVEFSPDEDMVLYIASSSATIPKNLIKAPPGASTQKEEREISAGRAYVYDIKEDKNFLIDEKASNLIIEGGSKASQKRRLSWFPTSRHLILAEEEKIVIMDYDATNGQTVYNGSYVVPQAFPALSLDRLIILTNLGASSISPNLYSLSIK